MRLDFCGQHRNAILPLYQFIPCTLGWRGHFSLMFPPIPFFTIWVQLLFLLLPPVSPQLLRQVRTCSFPSIPYTYFAPLLYRAEQSGTCKAIQFAHWLFFKLHLTHSSPMLKLIILATYDPTQILLQHITAFGHLYSACLPEL